MAKRGRLARARQQQLHQDTWKKHATPHMDKAINHVKEHVRKASSGKAALAESPDAEENQPEPEHGDWAEKRTRKTRRGAG